MRTIKKRDALKELARRRIRNDLTLYKKKMFRRYIHAEHLELLDRHLEQVTLYVETGGKEGIGRLIIEEPPRHGKTLTVSRFFPTWFLGRNPDLRVMMASYGATLAHKNSRLARNLMRSPWYGATFPNVSLAPDSQRADSWDVYDHEGGVDAMGMSGGATGKGAHLLIIDDPIKNRQEAESITYRNRIWDSFTNDFYTRLEPGGAIVIMATRWQEDDLTGRVLRNDDDGEWTRLRLPALAEENDPLGREVGAALWPTRFDEKSLHDIQKTLGPYAFAALYQQNPQPADGGIFKRDWFEIVSGPPGRVSQVVRYWDLAMSSKTTADYSVGTKMAIDDAGRRYVLDVQRKQVDWGDLVEWMAQVIIADGPTVVQGIEQQGYMSRAIQDLNADTRLAGYQIWGYPKDKDKVTNALPFAAKAAAGLVYVVQSGWTDRWIDEIVSFPNGAHDDQVDSVAGANDMLAGNNVAEYGVMVLDDSSGFSNSAY